MTMRLEDTRVAGVVAAIAAERRRVGATSTGMVLTLVIVSDEEHQSDATHAAALSAREHPCRIVTLIPRPSRSDPRLDASIDIGDTEGPGEVVRLRLRGSLAQHAADVTVPLLLPDIPVVAWWPTDPPPVPADDAVGRLAQRRITDAGAAPRPNTALAQRRGSYREGDTDLSWTRTTPWRSLLAAALDLPYAPISSADVAVEGANPSGPLLQAWLHRRLGVPVALHRGRAPEINSVVLHTGDGPIQLTRPDGATGHLSRPGVPSYEVPLRRPDLCDLIGEELRRLDPDEIYAQALADLRPISKRQR